MGWADGVVSLNLEDGDGVHLASQQKGTPFFPLVGDAPLRTGLGVR
jgi:hypothetical protein